MAKILVVDDNEVNRVSLVKLLVRYQFQVEAAIDGRDALQKAEATNPDLIITDMLMPNMDGFEFLRSIRASSFGKTVPIIAYTTLHLARSATQLSQEFGVAQVLTKPSKPELILKAVNTALGIESDEAAS